MKLRKWFQLLVLTGLIVFGSVITASGTELEKLLCDKNKLYTYDDMEQDINSLLVKYPQWIQADVLGKTFDGRSIYHLAIGQRSADKHILIFASIHGREHITTQLVMKQTASFLRQMSSENGTYRNIKYQELLKGKIVHIVPMVNPDGVTLSQLGLEGMMSGATRQKIYEIYELDDAVELEPYLKRWKSNAEGIDINRNFDACWEDYDDKLGHPSSDHYKGNTVACTAEAQALIELTNKYPFERTISYHAQGEVIYWYFLQDGFLLETSKAFAEDISKVTGYPLDANYIELDPAGYKDWAIQKMGIPSLTIEVGKGTVPLDIEQLPSIYEKNKNVLLETLYSIR